MGAKEEFWQALNKLVERQNQTEREILELKNTQIQTEKEIKE